MQLNKYLKKLKINKLILKMRYYNQFGIKEGGLMNKESNYEDLKWNLS